MPSKHRIAAVAVAAAIAQCAPALALDRGPPPAAAATAGTPGRLPAPAPAARPHPHAAAADRVTASRFAPLTLQDEYGARSTSYSMALQAARDNRVDSAVKNYGSRLGTFYFRLRDGSVASAVPPANSLEIEKALAASGVELTVEDGNWLQTAGTVVSFMTSVLFLLMIAAWGWRSARKFVGSPARRFRRGSAQRIGFADVAGQDAARKELQEVIEFLREPKKFSGLGGRVPRGVLLDGEPGNGKTLLARAVAGEAGVPFLHVSGSDILEMFAGLGARRIRKMFSTARKHRHGCILFIDEIDVVGRKRHGGMNSDVGAEGDQILTQLLTELDGIEKKGNVVLIAATNRPEILDPALLRPGRFDRRVHVPNPDTGGREDILRVHARKVKLAADTDLAAIAAVTPGFSGADLANLVNEAALAAGRMGKAEVDAESFDAARDKALMGEARTAGSVAAEERAVAACHEAGHALVAIRTEGADPVYKVSVLPRGRALGMVVQIPARDRLIISRTKLEAALAVAMGGRAAEEAVYGRDSITTGASRDIQQATRTAREMGGRLGMFDELGCMDYLGGQDGSGAASPMTMARVDDAVAAKLRDAYGRASAIILAEMDGLSALAERLVAEDTLTGAQVRDLLDGVLAAAGSPPCRG